MEDRYLAAMRRIGWLVDVMHAEQRGRMFAIQFDEHTLRLAAKGWSSADRRGQDNSAARGHVAGLDNRPIDRPEESIADGLRHHRQVHVEESRIAGIDTGAQVRVRLIGCAEADGIGFRQCAVKRRTRRGAGENADLERLAALVSRLGALRDCGGNRFRRPRRSESAEANSLSVFYVRRRLFWRQLGEWQAHC